MLDRTIRRVIDPTIDRIGRGIARTGVSANAITLAGLTLGLAAAGAAALGQFGVALGLVLASRLADGLDGAVARATTKSDFGGFLDIVCDFLFYGAIPAAFIFHDPGANALAGAVLLVSFYFNGATFLGFAILAERHGLETRGRGDKSLYFTGGLLEGSETIGFFILLCLFPDWFSAAAAVFAALCFVTATSRVLLAAQVFRGM